MHSLQGFGSVVALAVASLTLTAAPALAAQCDSGANRYQIVSVYRANRPTHFHWAADRLSDSPGGMVADAYEPAVAVNVSVTDCSPERLNDFGDQDQTETIWLNEGDLTFDQIRALNQPSMRVRRAAFAVSARSVQRNVRQIDEQRSTLCDDDSVRCDDLIVSEPVVLTETQPVIGPAF